MSNVPREFRSFETITKKDLQRLNEMAAADRDEYFRINPEWAVYRNRLIGVALCQGAALNLLDGETGIQDLDVYSFFAEVPGKPWYAKRIVHRDFIDPKFGKSTDRIGVTFKGRRVDLTGRSLKVPVGADPVAAIRSWIEKGKIGTSPAYLADKGIFLLDGTLVWDCPWRPDLNRKHVLINRPDVVGGFIYFALYKTSSGHRMYGAYWSYVDFDKSGNVVGSSMRSAEPRFDLSKERDRIIRAFKEYQNGTTC